MMRTRTEITIETDRVLVVGHRHHRPLLRCNQCAEMQHFLSMAEVTAATGIAPPAIYELAEVCRVHFVLTAQGEFLICPNSPVLTTDDGR